MIGLAILAFATTFGGESVVVFVAQYVRGAASACVLRFTPYAVRAAESAASAGVTTAVQRGSAVIGRYPGYLQRARELGAGCLDVPPEIWDRLTPSQAEAVTRWFLDEIIARKLPVDLSTVWREAVHAGSWFAWEVEYLSAHGYTLTEDAMRLLPPGPH